METLWKSNDSKSIYCQHLRKEKRKNSTSPHWDPPLQWLHPAFHCKDHTQWKCSNYLVSYINIKQFKIIILVGHQEKCDHIIFQYLKHIFKQNSKTTHSFHVCFVISLYLSIATMLFFFFWKRNKRKENIFEGLLWFETNLFQTLIMCYDYVAL